MSKKIFTKEEIELLTKNKYVKSVSEKAITYTDEFKHIFISENSNGMLTMSTFIKYGFDVDVLGIKRVKSCGKRWRRRYREDGILGLDDSRKNYSGRTRKKERTIEEELERLKAQNALLKSENDLLKKLEMIERVVVNNNNIKLSASDKYILINDTIKKYQIKNMTSYLCTVANVSRSGYYNYFSASSIKNRSIHESNDEIVRDIVLKAYKFKRRRKGAKQIKTTLKMHFGITYNLKRIRRVMKKYRIVCGIRKISPYKKMLKATTEHSAVPNTLKREFKQGIPGKVLLTDITYLNYGMGHRAYLSTIFDGSTNEILAYNVSKNLELSIVTNTIRNLLISNRSNLHKEAFIHSDQGAHVRQEVA